MFNKFKDPPAFEIIIPCDCRTEKIVISKFDDDCPLYYVAFYVHSFYSCQSLWWTFKDRVKMAWEALRKGNFIHQELTLSPDSIKELKEDLEKLMEIEANRKKEMKSETA